MAKKKLAAWEQWEEEVADYLDGKRQKGSGRFVFAKGDVRCADFLVECKQTGDALYNLNIKTWEKLVCEARNMFKIPLFAARSQAGDFFVLSEIDYIDYVENGEEILDSIEFIDYDERKTLPIDREFKTKFKGIDGCWYYLVCSEVDVSDIY